MTWYPVALPDKAVIGHVFWVLKRPPLTPDTKCKTIITQTLISNCTVTYNTSSNNQICLNFLKILFKRHRTTFCNHQTRFQGSEYTKNAFAAEFYVVYILYTQDQRV